MKHLRIQACLAAALLLISASAQESKESKEASALQAARAVSVTAKGKKAFYANRWNLDDLPEYKPEQQVSGVIREWGANYFTDGNLAEYWETASSTRNRLR